MTDSALPNFIALLESFIVENDDLERLEQLLGQFNLFEAIGADDRSAFVGLIRELVETNPDLQVERVTRTAVIFAPIKWFESAELLKGEGRMPSGQLILFQIRADKPGITLWIGPGDREVRQRLLDIALAIPTRSAVRTKH